MSLRTDYKNDVLNTSVNEERRFEEVTNPDGTKSYRDVTDYSQVGDSFDADLVNSQNTEINAKAPIDSPAFTGNPTAPTQAQSTADDTLATTAFVKSAIGNLIDPNLRTYGKAADAQATGNRIASVQASIPYVDTTLTTNGAAADAQATGNRISNVNDELVDIRVKADGQTATTAGDAVREQITELNNDLNEVYSQINTNVVFKKRDTVDLYVYTNLNDYLVAITSISCEVGDVVNISGTIVALVKPSNWQQLGLRINEIDANNAVLSRTNLTSWSGETNYTVSNDNCDKISINLFVTRRDEVSYTERFQINILARIGTNILDTFASASDMDSLRFAIDGINTGYAPIEPELTNGSINASTGENTTTDYTKTKGYTSTDDADIVSASQDPRNIYVYVHYYNYSDGNYVWQKAVTNRNSLDKPITIDTNYEYFRVVAYYNTNPFKIPLDSFYDVVHILKKYDSEQIDDLKERVTVLEDGNPVLPEYWQTYMDQKIPEISAKNLLLGASGVGFVFLTDTHVKYNSLLSPSLIRYILKNTAISKVVNGGDWINLDASKSTCIARLEQWNKLMNGVDEIRIRGNHDLNNFNGTNTANQLTFGEFYALMDRPMEKFVNTDGKTYFVVDNESQKFRLIVVDSEFYNSSANWSNVMSWMKTKLTELGSDWTVLVVQHTLYGTTEGVLAPVGQSVIDNINSVYSSINATFIGILSGHSHRDYNATEPTNGYALIVTNCDTLDGNYSGLTREAGTVTEQSFDVVSIDFTNRKIYMTRIGAGADREISY